MLTVIETTPYLKAAEKIFTEQELADIVSLVSFNPDCGEVIPGTGGFRKVRVARRGMGKRGGARVIYIVKTGDDPVFLVAAYAKNERDNLSQAERNILKLRADDFYREYRSRK